jgi:short-subunit dehydrogenase
MFDTPKRALITGASSGIGAALALRIARRGTEVWLCARRKEKLQDEVRRIEQAGGKAHALELDVADADATHARLRRLDAEVGGIDLAIANAGIGGDYVMGDFAKMPWASIKNVFNTNLIGAIATLDAFVPGMVERGHGQLVGVSSLAADINLPRGAAYNASKAGLTHYLESADIDLRRRGVPVTIVHPGFVKTPMVDSLKEATPFLMELDEAVEIIDRAIQRKARLVRFPFPLAAVTLSANALPRALRSWGVRMALKNAHKGQ